MSDDVSAALDEVGCDGSLHVEAADGRSVEVRADEPFVAASLIKVLVAVEVERQIGSGQINPMARVGLPTEPRTGGPVGFSFYQDPVELSVRDLAVPMLTVSDNVATDALIQLVGLASCNATAADLGLEHTRLDCNLQTAIDQIGQAAGFADYSALIAWSEDSHSADELARVDEQAMSARSLDVATATTTSARDMCRLLQAIWTDCAAPRDGCARIRHLMAHQLTRHRIASGFPRSVGVAAKSGGLVGVYRHEAAMVEFADGERYAVAVLTKTRSGHAGDQAINAAIGRAAARAIGQLRPSSV